jgi:hypothetical protein
MPKYKTINKLSKASYQKNKDIQDIDGYTLDKKLSTKENKVFHNDETGQTVVANRGTIGTVNDWSNNAAYVTQQYGKTDRFKHAKKVQKRALDKYGSVDANIGHSQGAVIARKLKKKQMTKQVVNINPATLGQKEDDNVTTLKSSRDVVSVLHRKDKNTDIIGAKSYNPLTEHSSTILDRNGDKELIGFGFHFHVPL